MERVVSDVRDQEVSALQKPAQPEYHAPKPQTVLIILHKVVRYCNFSMRLSDPCCSSDFRGLT